ncbi:MAG TPA: YihY/virulence factor BrkB family protein [Pyrinomonadaceae bacterium]|nr:YihY/virulence factor BrkB family protein [Pyrinomonadaceae bacterium]
MLQRLLSKGFWANVWARTEKDEIFGRAAQLAYFFLLALFPLLLFLITLFGYFNGGSQLQRKMIAYLSDVMPHAALQLVVATLDEVTRDRGTGKLSLGILLALWAASSGVNALAQALNSAYDVPETRPWWKVRLISIGLTIFLSILIISALLLILYGGHLGHALAATIHAGPAFAMIWRALQIPIALVFVLIALVMIYRFAPNAAAKRQGKGLRESDYRRRWFSPGTIIGLGLWLMVSLGFRLYLHFFNSYNATYGSLGALIILMLWFYLTGAAILLGGEINCEYETEARE